jgi:hypothetical protein
MIGTSLFNSHRRACLVRSLCFTGCLLAWPLALSSCMTENRKLETAMTESAAKTAQTIKKTKVIRWDLRTLDRAAAGVVDTLDYANYQDLDAKFDVTITSLSGKVLRMTSDLVTVRTDGPTGPVVEIAIKQSLLPMAEADRLLDVLVAEWGVNPVDVDAWKASRSSLGPLRVLPTSEPELSVQFLNDATPPTAQTVDFQFFSDLGFGRRSPSDESPTTASALAESARRTGWNA